MARRKRRLLGKARGDKIWVAGVMNNNLTANVPNSIDIVQGSDWADASTGLERATLLSIRGWVNPHVDFISGSHLEIFMLIRKSSVGATQQTLSAVEAYVDDILWTGGFAIQSDTSGTGSQQRNRMYEINVKAKRKITSDDIIRFSVLSPSIAGGVVGVFRALLVRD